MSAKSSIKINLILISLLTVLIVGYQNCSKFAPTLDSTKNTSLNAPPTEPDTDPGQAGPQVITRSLIYLGGNGFIQGYELDHLTDQLAPLQRVSLPNQAAGWMAFDAKSTSLFVSSERGTNLAEFSLDRSSGTLSLQKNHTFLSQSVHVELSRHSGGFSIYGSSYNGAQFARYDFHDTDRSLTSDQTFSFASGAHTHSSTVDEVRNLVFVANKDEERIVIYHRDALGVLTEAGVIALNDPRMVKYDRISQKLYVVTEADSGQSAVAIYSIDMTTETTRVPNVVTATAQSVGSFAMGLRGSDFAINSARGFVFATVRESGREGIWALPITPTGVFDATRSNVFIPVSGPEPRSLQVSSDGTYFVVTCNRASNLEDLFIYKAAYSSTNALQRADLIHEVDAGASTFASHFMIDVN